jgi:hypothetical protein
MESGLWDWGIFFHDPVELADGFVEMFLAVIAFATSTGRWRLNVRRACSAMRWKMVRRLEIVLDETGRASL